MIFPGPIRDAFRRLHQSDEGVSLVEALVAVIILSTAILALVATAATSTVSLRLSRDRQQAVQTASAALENVRNTSWDALVLTASSVPAAMSEFEGETLVAAADGPIPHVVTDGRFSTTTYITWVTDPTNPLKRVTAITAWEDRGESREVRESTLVAIAERGLPVPNFIITPDTSIQQAVSGSPVCFTYSLANLGERDSYSYQAGQLSSGTFTAGEWRSSYTVDGVAREGFKVSDLAGGPWFVWATLGTPVSGSSPEMKDVTGDLRPDSAGPVERRESVPVEFCAVPHREATNQSRTPSFAFRLYSAFDDTVLRDATGQVSDTIAYDRLYMVAGGSNNPRTRYQLARTKPTRTDVTFDHDSPADGRPGLRFRPGASGDRANWDFQPGASRIEGTATLTLFVANTETLLGTDDGRDETVSLQLRVERLNAQRNVSSPIFSGTITISEADLRASAGGGWALVRTSIALPTTNFTADEYLRLSLWDASAADDDGSTHVHYDVNESGPGDDPAAYGGSGLGSNERLMSNLSIRVVPQ